jgi:hypothetical protein
LWSWEEKAGDCNLPRLPQAVLISTRDLLPSVATSGEGIVEKAVEVGDGEERIIVVGERHY